jgi:hypothetical protein
MLADVSTCERAYPKTEPDNTDDATAFKWRERLGKNIT